LYDLLLKTKTNVGLEEKKKKKKKEMKKKKKEKKKQEEKKKIYLSPTTQNKILDLISPY
jgi:hypothetical protein